MRDVALIQLRQPSQTFIFQHNNPMQRRGWRKPSSNNRLLLPLIPRSKQQYERWMAVAV